MTREELKELIDEEIKENGQGEITGPVLNNVLQRILETLPGQRNPETNSELFNSDFNTAIGENSHAEGLGTKAVASASHAEGRYNKGYDEAIHEVGIGTNNSTRRDAHVITVDGKHYVLGLGGFNIGNEDLADCQDLVTIIQELGYVVPISRGGTGATTSKTAASNLQVLSLNNPSASLQLTTDIDTIGPGSWGISQSASENPQLPMHGIPGRIDSYYLNGSSNKFQIVRFATGEVFTRFANSTITNYWSKWEKDDAPVILYEKTIDSVQYIIDGKDNILNFVDILILVKSKNVVVRAGNVEHIPSVVFEGDSESNAKGVVEFSAIYYMYDMARTQRVIINEDNDVKIDIVEVEKTDNKVAAIDSPRRPADDVHYPTTKAVKTFVENGLSPKQDTDKMQSVLTESDANYPSSKAVTEYVKVKEAFEKGTGTYSVVQKGGNNVASDKYAYAEGHSTTASGNNSHAEGYSTTASGSFSHAEGYFSIASGSCSHAEGNSTTANGIYSHAEGNSTIASGSYSHAEGAYNVGYQEAIHEVGIGYSKSQRKNAHTITVNGKHYILGIGGYDGTQTDLSQVDDLATILNDIVGALETEELVLKSGTSETNKKVYDLLVLHPQLSKEVVFLNTLTSTYYKINSWKQENGAFRFTHLRIDNGSDIVVVSATLDANGRVY